jgi:hypothetical protein
VLDFGKTLWAIETKLTSNPSAGDVAAFVKAADLIKADKKILISRTNEHLENDDVISTNLQSAMKIIKS